MSGGVFKIHIVRDTPCSVASDALRMFDDEIRLCFAPCAAIEFPNDVWYQTQLRLIYRLLYLLLTCCCYLYCLIDILGLWQCCTLSMQGQCPTTRSSFPNHYIYSRICSGKSHTKEGLVKEDHDAILCSFANRARRLSVMQRPGLMTIRW